jgi:6-pyruvoyl-tetrahydropterin synthase
MNPLDDKKPTKGTITIEYSYECLSCEDPCDKKSLEMTISPITKDKKTTSPSKEMVAQALVEALAAHLSGTTASVEEALSVAAHAAAELADVIIENKEKEITKITVPKFFGTDLQ